MYENTWADHSGALLARRAVAARPVRPAAGTVATVLPGRGA